MSEFEASMPVRKNFSRREWLMVIIILLMMQAGALTASHKFMSNQDVINYISFASTIASLLLAVLAIVYGFYQSESQKRAGDGVEVHLSHLRTTADQIRAVSTTLSENSSGVSELSTSLKTLNETLHVTQNKLSAVEGSVNGFAKQQESFGASLKEMRGNPVDSPVASRQPLSESINEDVAKIVLGENSGLHIKLVAIAILFAFEGREGVEIEINEIGQGVSNFFAGEKLFGWSSDAWTGAVVVAFTVLISVDLIDSVADENDMVKSLTFNIKKRNLLNEVAEDLWKTPKRVELLGKLKKSMQELSSETATS